MSLQRFEEHRTIYEKQSKTCWSSIRKFKLTSFANSSSDFNFSINQDASALPTKHISLSLIQWTLSKFNFHHFLSSSTLKLTLRYSYTNDIRSKTIHHLDGDALSRFKRPEDKNPFQYEVWVTWKWMNKYELVTKRRRRRRKLIFILDFWSFLGKYFLNRDGRNENEIEEKKRENYLSRVFNSIYSIGKKGIGDSISSSIKDFPLLSSEQICNWVFEWSDG